MYLKIMDRKQSSMLKGSTLLEVVFLNEGLDAHYFDSALTLGLEGLDVLFQ
jgi:hypothetical protein